MRFDWGAVAIAGAALAVPVVLFKAARAASMSVRMNPNVYTKGECVTNPQAEDPSDKHLFTYYVDWYYYQNGVELQRGRVGKFTVEGSSGGNIDISNPLDPIPEYIIKSNPLGIQPNDWTTYECPSPPNPWFSTLCNPSKPNRGCCILGFKTGNNPVITTHKLSYRVTSDPCGDCHYEACTPYHDVPKGGGVPMVFKYIRREGDCWQIPDVYCNRYTNDAPCGWEKGPFGQYRRPCYILIR